MEPYLRRRQYSENLEENERPAPYLLSTGIRKKMNTAISCVSYESSVIAEDSESENQNNYRTACLPRGHLLSSGDPGPSLYDGSHREPEPEDQESGQGQGDLPQRPGTDQASLSGR